jgi:hypothetical protein
MSAGFDCLKSGQVASSLLRRYWQTLVMFLTDLIGQQMFEHNVVTCCFHLRNGNTHFDDR